MSLTPKPLGKNGSNGSASMAPAIPISGAASKTVQTTAWTSVMVLAIAMMFGCSGAAQATKPSSKPSQTNLSSPIIENDSAQTLAVVNAAERFANSTCACANAVCADVATNEFVDWLRTHPKREGSAVAAKRVLVALEKMLFCRDRLAYPSDPIDLEAS